MTNFASNPVVRFLARRILYSVVVMIGVLVVVFALVHLVPGDPVRIALGTRYTPEAYNALRSAGYIGLVLLLASCAIYVGRDLRWNSWDVLTNPAGLLFDVSDRLLVPSGYGAIAVTVLSFFALLGSMYALAWGAARLVRATAR